MKTKMNHKPSLLYVGNKLSNHGFTPGVIETLGPLLESEGYHIYYAGTHRSQLVRLIEIISKVFIYGRKVNYIVIDTFSTSAFWFAYFSALVARLINVPYIPILHGGDLPRRLADSKRACKSLFTNSYANVAVSGYLKHEFEEKGYNVILIPNSIEIRNYPYKLREKCRPRLLWVRSFHRQYNPNMAADVLGGLLNAYPDAELCMVGPEKDGAMADFRNYLDIIGLKEHVKVTGLLKKEEWINISEDYDFFINTTNIDNTPVSVIEAMALGLIVISTDAGGLKYLLNAGHDSIMVARGDAIAMSKAISMAMNDKSSCKKLSFNARQSAMNFDWSRVKNQWTDLLLVNNERTKRQD